MDIEQFVAQTEGEWRSMRSAHSLAFQQFEDVLSEISVEKISETNSDLWSFQLLRGNSSSSLKGDLSGITAKLGGAVYQNLPLAVVPPSSKEATGWSFRRSKNLQDAPTRLGVGAGQEGTTYRVEVTGYSANNVRRISRYTKSNRVYYIPFDKLSEQFIRIHREGGKISSITPVT